jgi:ABC-type molybdate transport system permease subunit
VTVTNTGTVPVSISNVSVTSGTRASSREFLALSLCPPSLAVHSICKIAVAFFAQDLGPQSATLKIASNAAGNPLSIPLSATVVP